MPISETSITCRANSCSKLVYNAIPWIFQHSKPSYEVSKYCSDSCALQALEHEKDARWMYRIEKIIHAAFMEYSDVDNEFLVLWEREYVDRENSIRLVMVLRRFCHPDAVSLLGSNYLSIDGRRSYLSLNRCITVLCNFSGMMAYLAEEFKTPVTIREAHITNVRSDQEIRVLLVHQLDKDSMVGIEVDDEKKDSSNDGDDEDCEGGEDCVVWKVAGIHSMFWITARSVGDTSTSPGFLASRELYSDTTAKQYGREPGLQDVGVYHCDHPLAAREHQYILGHAYTEHLTRLEREPKEAAQWHKNVFQIEALIRTSNNAAYEVIKEVGGRSELREMGLVAFEDVLVRLGLRVRQALRLIADRNYKIHRSHDPDALEMYEKVIQGCLGEGHREFLGALLRCSPGVRTQKKHYFLLHEKGARSII